MRVLSLGWGVQSFTLAAMVALGELEPIDAAVHADTTHERSQTYGFAEKWTGWLEERGVKVVTVLDASVIDVWHGKMIPAIMDNGRRRAFRTCTHRWKMIPIQRWIQANRNKEEKIELLLGISTDEFQRMRDSKIKYITNYYPLVDMGMSRTDCAKWLIKNNLEIPVSSSCVFCPYHSDKAWREIKLDQSGDWDRAITVDRAIRKARPPYDLFLHRSCKPLADVDLRTPQEKGQMELWANWDEECSGICGV